MSKTKVLMTTGMFKKFNNDKIKRFEDMVRDLKLKCEERHEQVLVLEKKNKLLLAVQEKMKQRYNKLKARKGKDPGFKQCKDCMKEFLDRENYNWSCRTHRCEWSGEMWWCCGKRSKDAAGCKFKKHVSKEDEEDPIIGGDPNDADSKNLRS